MSVFSKACNFLSLRSLGWATAGITISLATTTVSRADTVTVGTFGGPTGLDLTGPFYLAANVGSTTNAGDLTVGGANFLSLSNSFNDTGGKATLTGVTGGDLNPFAVIPAYTGPNSTDNANLDTIMHSLSYTATPTPMEATIVGLSPNTQYKIQALVSENNYKQIVTSTTTGREFGISVNGVAAFPNTTDIIAESYPGAQPGVNQWNSNPTQGIVVTDIFTTGPAQTTATIDAVYGDPLISHVDANAYFNAFTIKAVPEPASLSLLALGAAGMCARRRRV